MRISKLWVCVSTIATVGLAGAPAPAAMPVVDTGAIAQLVTQVRTLADQLQTARDQLGEARRALQSMTGGRGMEQLLANTERNYLPPDWQALQSAVQGAQGAYRVLAREVQSVIDTNAVLTPAQLSRLSAAEREQVAIARRSTAMLGVTARQALATTSARFESIQRLVDAIAVAQDQKAILDLNARIAAEQGMLTNEHTKLAMLFQAAQADALAQEQRLREQAIADIGSLRRLPAMGLR